MRESSPPRPTGYTAERFNGGGTVERRSAGGAQVSWGVDRARLGQPHQLHTEWYVVLAPPRCWDE